MVEIVAKSKREEGGGERMDGMVEVVAKREICERRWEVVDSVIKIISKGKMSERGRERYFETTIKRVSKNEADERGRESVNFVIEVRPKSKVNEGVWKRGDRLIKMISKCEVCEREG